jgi:hypothetical protein
LFSPNFVLAANRVRVIADGHAARHPLVVKHSQLIDLAT